MNKYKVTDVEDSDGRTTMILVMDTLTRYHNSTPYYGINVVISRSGKVKDLVVSDDDAVAIQELKNDRQQIIDVALQYYWEYKSELPDKFDENTIKKSSVKPLIKLIIREIYNIRKQLNEWSSGTLNGYEAQLNDVTIPGISNEKDFVVVEINIDYQSDAGSAEKGQFGSPSKHIQGSGTEVEIRKINISLVKILDEKGQVKSEIDDLKTLTPEQKTTLEKAVKDYVDLNEDDIIGEILDKKDNGSEEHYFTDR